MKLLETVIYYDKDTKVYNYPFIIKFKNEEKRIDFFFKETDYNNQEEMIKTRLDMCSMELYKTTTQYFESLQLICLNDSIEAKDESVDNINSLLEMIYNLLIILDKIHCSSDVYKLVHTLYDELLEMFLLIEDYYTLNRKGELVEWKKKFMDLY